MDKLLIQNGLLHLAIGILVGMPYMRAISKDFEKNQESWRIAHLSGLITGALMMALASVLKEISVSETTKEVFGYLFISSNWIFMLGLFISAISGERGLTRRPKKKIGLVIFTLYCLASVLSLLSAFMMIWFVFNI